MIVSLLTDYGLDDEFVGVCHGVIRRTAPDVPIVDITHGITRHAVREGALTLRNALPYTPPGVHVAVVDPGRGPVRWLGPRSGNASGNARATGLAGVPARAARARER